MNLQFELVTDDCDAIETFTTREAALKHVTDHYGEYKINPPQPHYPMGTLEVIQCLEAGCELGLLTAEADEDEES